MAALECAAVKAFDLTTVYYATGDSLGKIMALASLSPVFIVAQVVALLAVRRDWQTIVFFVGLLANVALNHVLKNAVQEARPQTTCLVSDAFDPGSFEEFGMPSNHAQFAGFVATFTTLFLWKYVDAPLIERAGIVCAAWTATGLCSYSRVYLGYHSAPQVAVGMGVGSAAAVIWFGLYVAFLRDLGRHLVKTGLFRSLLVRETSSVKNVLKAEYAAFGPLTARVVTLNATGYGQGGASSVDAIARMLVTSDPDVVCLQGIKGGSPAHSDINIVSAALRMSCVFTQADESASVGHGYAILSRWPVHSLERLVSSDGPGETPGRCVGAAAVVCPTWNLPERDFRVVSSDRIELERAFGAHLKRTKQGAAALLGHHGEWRAFPPRQKIWRMNPELELSVEESSCGLKHCPVVVEWVAS